MFVKGGIPLHIGERLHYFFNFATAPNTPSAHTPVEEFNPDIFLEARLGNARSLL